MNPENYDPPTFEEVMREKEDTITALRSEVEKGRALAMLAHDTIAALEAQLSARDADVRALRQFANATWREFRAAARMCGLLDLAGNPTALLTGEESER